MKRDKRGRFTKKSLVTTILIGVVAPVSLYMAFAYEQSQIEFLSPIVNVMEPIVQKDDYDKLTDNLNDAMRSLKSTQDKELEAEDIAKKMYEQADDLITKAKGNTEIANENYDDAINMINLYQGDVVD